jgi:hypothetical protein
LKRDGKGEMRQFGAGRKEKMVRAKNKITKIA